MLEDIEELRVFVQVVRSGSMVAAGRILSMPSNTVGRRIASLEDSIGRTLLIRTTRRIEVSEDGRRLYEHALRILATVEDAEDDLQSSCGLRGRMRLGVGTVSPFPSLLRRFARLLHENPGLSLSLQVSDEPFDVVAQGLDMAIVGGTLADSSLVAVRLSELYAGLAAHEDYLERAGIPRRRDDLAEHECLLFGGHGHPGIWRLTDRHGRTHAVEVGGRFVSNSSKVLSEALFAGLGIGLHPLPLDEGATTNRGIVRVLPSYRFGPLQINAVMPPSIAKTARVRAVLELLRAEVGRSQA